MRHYVHFKTYQKVISMFLVLSFLTIPLTFLTFPKQASAICTPFTIPAIPDPFSVPIHLSAPSATNIQDQFAKGNEWFKTCILDGLATAIAKTIIKQLTGSIVRWINSGFKGNPSFVQNPGKFFGGIADKVAGNVIENIAPFLCSPFRLNLQLALALSQSSSLDQEIGCTLTDVQQNLASATGGVSGGMSGWNDWFQVTQNAQNNPYGAAMIASAQLNIGVETAQGKYQQQLDWGKGFLSFEECPPANQAGTAGEVPIPGGNNTAVAYNNNSNTYTGTNIIVASKKNDNSNSLASVGSLGSLNDLFASINSRNATAQAINTNTSNGGGSVTVTAGNVPTGTNVGAGTPVTVTDTNVHTNPNNPNDTQIYDANNEPVYGVQAGNDGCVTKTPGAVIESQLNNTLGSDLRGLEIAQSIDQIVAALTGQLVSQALGGIGGLASAGNQSSSGSSSGFNYQNSIAGAGGAGAIVPNLPLTGACTPDNQNVAIGQPVTWRAYVSNLNGGVSYTWYGTDDLTSSASLAKISYATNGDKKASVIVTTSGQNPQSAQIDCVPDVQVGNTSASASTPTISCAASPSVVSLSSSTPVTWGAVVVGGTPPFVYSWTGDDGLNATGQSTIKTYTTTGIKSATVSLVDAAGDTYSNTCASAVSVTP